MDTKQHKGRKPSYRQMKAVEAWLRDGRRNKAKALRIAGYSSAVIHHPEKVFGSPVVQKFMREAGIQERVTLPKIKTEEELRGSVGQNANIQVVNVAEEKAKFALRIVQMSAEERRVLNAALDVRWAELERIEKEKEIAQSADIQRKVSYPTEVPYSYRYNTGGDPLSGF